ncbi:MAG: hypothetical protein P4L99_23740 [Chthoniobacter sp.]|nr:hypothetical protein [Chthoniobacter sp.]
MGEPVGSQVACRLVDDSKSAKPGCFMQTSAEMMFALVLLGLFALIVRPIGAAEPAAAPENAAERENAAMVAGDHQLQGGRAAVQTDPESHDLRKRHGAMLKNLYQRAKDCSPGG